jgi:hypothetical protein
MEGRGGGGEAQGVADPYKKLNYLYPHASGFLS